MVKGEQVRVAGANVGEVESVDVTLPGEVDSYEDGKAAGGPRQGGDRDEDRQTPASRTSAATPPA